MRTMIDFDTFTKIEMRLGKIIRVETFPEARKPAYQLWIDLGAYGVKQSSAQITTLYQREELLNRYVIAVTNLPPRRIAHFQSEVLVLGLDSVEGGVTLLGPDHEVELGQRVY